MEQTKLESYNPWLNWIMMKFNKDLSDNIKNEDWNNVTKFKNLWEGLFNIIIKLLNKIKI